MKTRTLSRSRLFGAALLLAALSALAGCATTGDIPKAAQAEQTSAPAPASIELARRDFYADWYDSTAIVLPPPPASARR